tara:strand:- start:178007 stop:181378 length:3372 start_codon:yes stop_codon:yes gene_type:complete
MKKSKDKSFRAKVRAAAMLPKSKGIFGTLRQNISASNYEHLITTFKQVDAIQTNNLLRLGPTDINSLLGLNAAIPLTLLNEIKWAKSWLKDQSYRINVYRKFSIKLQDDLLDKDISDVIISLENFCEENGWSIWAIELRLALEQQHEGTEALKSLSSKWRSKNLNAKLGLFIQVITDRNDSSYSYDAFYWKCISSFPRISSGDDFSGYLMYKSLTHLDNAEEQLPRILARDIRSSLIDYYESIIETIISITELTPEKIKAYAPATIELIDSLIDEGFLDGRLNILQMKLTQTVPDSAIFISRSNSLKTLSKACISNIQIDEKVIESKSFLNKVLKYISNLSECGASDQDSSREIIKLGLNFKSLDIGLLMAISQKIYTSKLTESSVLPIEMTFCSHEINNYALLLNDDNLIDYLESVDVESQIYKAIKGESITQIANTPSLLHIWLGKWLIAKKRWKDINALCHALSQHNFYWQRQADKLQLLALIDEEKTFEALSLTATWLTKDPLHAYEFPIENIFQNRGWGDFKNLDLILVGLVSHFTFESTQNSDIHYICKMSCRAIGITGGLNIIHDQLSSDPKLGGLLIVFLRDVWISDNLVMNHFLETTEAVQHERMKVLQLLLQFDPEHESEHVDAIKDLTFDETVRSGLKYIDQTRVFVNEGAIFRWAEKNLYQDYERWIQLLRGNNNFYLNDNLINQYLVDPKNTALLQELTSDNPSEADALLTIILERLYGRFLLDPNDGLDYYLSARIRHGSLRGTIFGPLDENQLLYSKTQFSRTTFESTWNSTGKFTEQNSESIFNILKELSVNLQNIIQELITERVQIYSDKKPKGEIPGVIPVTNNKEPIAIIRTLLSEEELSFDMLVNTSFFFFWKLLDNFLKNIANYIRGEVKVKIQDEFDKVFKELSTINVDTRRLETMLHNISTATQLQCETVADWFRLPNQGESGGKFSFEDAIEISKNATKNVYRNFPIEIKIDSSIGEHEIFLSTLGLSTITDCLFIMLENAWKHSGLYEAIGIIEIKISFDAKNSLITITSTSNLSRVVVNELNTGKFKEIEKKYANQDNSLVVRKEGGSGFAKLARFATHMDRAIIPKPLEFDIFDDKWMIKITIPLYEQEGVYNAYN